MKRFYTEHQIFGVLKELEAGIPATQATKQLVLTSRDDLSRAALETGKPFHGKFVGAPFQWSPN